MTTFGLPSVSNSLESDDFGYPSDDALKPVPNIDIVSADDSHFLSSEGSGSNISAFGGKPPPLDPEEFIRQAALQLEDYPLIPTQTSQPSQPRPYDPEREKHLVGCMIPATPTCKHYELFKPGREWSIGRHPSNDLILIGPRLSNYHCTLHWNGEADKHSQVTLIDRSSNGTWVNSIKVTHGGSAILHSGVAISFGAHPDDANEWRYIYRDIEGQSMRHMKQIWAKYDVGSEIGAGAFARVHRCVHRATNVEYAVKIINRTKLRGSHAGERGVVREISILKQLAEYRHKHIVALREYFEEEDSIYLILELVKGGDLLTYIGTKGALNEKEVRRMAAQICHAVAYIHSQGIAHRDLKPENIMVTAGEPPDCKVADFGLAKLVDGGTFLKTMCGTPAYLAPEVMLRSSAQAYDNRVDSWSLGIIFYCMLTNHAPFHEQYDATASPEEQKHYFGSRCVDWRLLDAMHLSDEGHDFLRHLLKDDPRERKTVTSMLDHHWIAPLVPPAAQLRHPSSPPSSSPTTDGTALACSQSMEQLNLSDIPIPGLSLIANATPDQPQPQTQSFDVTARIPGAFPRARAPLPAVVEDPSWEVVPRAASPTRVPGKHVLAGSSPLSALSDEEDSPPPPPPQPQTKPRARKPPARPRRTAYREPAVEPSSPEEAPRRSARRAKVARYA